MFDFDHSLFHKLNTYAKSDSYPFHMPGHKRNTFLQQRTIEYNIQSGTGLDMCCFRQSSPESIDITEITGFDDLHHPEGLLKKAQEQMAEVFGAKKSFFLVNGSTVGILAAICACTKKGGRILMARNCHKSIYHAALLQELSIDYLYPDVTKYGIAGSIFPEMVSQKISEMEMSKVMDNTLSHGINVQSAAGKQSPYQAIVITSPTYDGIVSDIAAISGIAHAHDIPLIVDEAHGAHFGFSKGFPQKALACGADIVIESIHKTLPAFTQSAALHVSDSPYIDVAKIRQYLSVFQTSSPSYILMAGLDRCTQLLKADSAHLFSNFENRLAAFYEKAVSLKNITVLYASDHLQNLRGTKQKTNRNLQTTDNHLLKPDNTKEADVQVEELHIFQKDPSKILISADSVGMTGGELFAVLRDKYHLELEMASLHYVTALTSIMDTQVGFDRLICALEELDQTRDTQPDNRSCENEKRAGSGEGTGISYRKNKPGAHSSDSSAHINVIPGQENSSDLQEEMNLQLPMCLCEAAELTKESVSLASAAGKICADFIIPYPPGIPLLVPGEMITEEHVKQITQYLNETITIYGIS